MDSAGTFFLCRCCGTQFPSALLLSQHCATHHQVFELSPFISVGSLLPTNQGMIGQAPSTSHDISDQTPLARKHSDITLTQLQTVTPSSQANNISSSHLQQQEQRTKHGKSDKLSVSSSNTAVQFGSGYFVMPETNNVLIKSSNDKGISGKAQYARVVNPITSAAYSQRVSSNATDNDGICDTQTTCVVENQFLPLVVGTSTSEKEGRLDQTQTEGMYTVPSRFSVIQSSHCGQTGKRDKINENDNQNQKQNPHCGPNTVLTPVVSVKENANLGQTNQTEGSHRLPSSMLAVLPLNQQQKVLLSHTPVFPMGVLSAMGVPQIAPIIKPTKPPRGSGPRPFSCSTCDKTFTLKCNLQQHEVYAHSDDRPYACSKCDKAFKLKGHLKEHEHNAHSEDRPFKCLHCEKTFKQKSHLTGHMSIHSGSKPHRCETCGLVFRQKQHLKRHALTHTGKRLFCCPQCPSTFNLSSDLKRHTRIHSGEKPFSCSRCGKGFARKQAVKIHEKIHFKPFTCQRCNKSFRDLQGLAEHEKKHVKSLLHDCRECAQSFSLYIELKEHMKTHIEKSTVAKRKKTTNKKNLAIQHLGSQRVTRQRMAAIASRRKIKPKSLRLARKGPDSSTTLQVRDEEENQSCSVCQRTFRRRCYVMRHELKCHGIQHTPYQCEECGKTFTGQNALIIHYKEHKDPERFRCNQCDEAFQRESLLHRHLLSTHGVKPFSCDVCSKTFVQKKSYVEHSRTCKKEGIVSCDLCQDVFKEKASLLRHKVKVHNLRPYTCSICEKGFSEKGTLQRHLVTHSSDRPYQCQYCSKAFKEKRQVDQHEMTHRGERPFQCFQCGLSFHRKAYLERHEAIHTGEKRFSCPHCPRAFFMGHDLKRHLRIHTGEKPFVCKICKKAFRRKAAVAYHEKQVHMRKFQCSYCSRKFFTKPELDAHTVIHLGVPPPQTPVEKSGPSHRTDDSAEDSSGPLGFDSLGGPSAPALSLCEDSDTPLLLDSPVNDLTKSTGVTTGSCGTREGSGLDKMSCQPSDVPSHNSSTSGPDSIRNIAPADPSDATSVTFFLCNSCGSLFPSAAMLARHTQQHHNPSLSINNPGPKPKPSKRQRTGHGSRSKMKKKDTGEAIDRTMKTHMCAECGEEFIGDLTSHECIDGSSIPLSPGPEDVEDLGPDYVDPVWTGGQSREKDESLYYCGVCDKGFKKISSRNVHQRIHTGDKPFVCKTCNKAFSVKSNLKQHEIAKHSDARPYACSKCDAKFKQRSHLKSHEEIHAGTKKYECSVCRQTFRQASHLQRHKLVHEGTKPFKCEQCPSAFNLASDLQRHSLIHLGVKPFQCDQCEKRFRRKFQLKVHQQTHTGELPLCCPHCTKAFMDKNCFESHVSAHEGKALHKCDSCNKSFSTDYVLKHHSCGKKTTMCFNCKQCCKSFKYKHSLDKHRCKVETGREGCVSLALQPENNHRHKSDAMEKNKNKNICEVCGMTFKRKSILHSHANLHSKEQTDL